MLSGAALLTLRPAGALALGGTLPELDRPAPDFDLPGNSSLEPERRRWRLADFRGSWLVLYFYPRDFTGGCTLEARGFQASLDRYRDLGATVVGVSADSVDEHGSFCSSEGLTFPLLSDPDGGVSRRYGSWISPFSQRHTFLIDPDGILRERWLAVRPSRHAGEVAETLERLQGGPRSGSPVASSG
jgi:peroxiredoxin Q/BCP